MSGRYTLKNEERISWRSLIFEGSYERCKQQDETKVPYAGEQLIAFVITPFMYAGNGMFEKLPEAELGGKGASWRVSCHQLFLLTTRMDGHPEVEGIRRIAGG